MNIFEFNTKKMKAEYKALVIIIIGLLILKWLLGYMHSNDFWITLLAGFGGLFVILLAGFLINRLK